MPDLISIIATTFNRADALDAVLRSLSRQDDRQFEVVIADDGSAPETAELIEKWKPRLGVPLAHVWQEHRGFRAAEIRNRALCVKLGQLLYFSRRRLLGARRFCRQSSPAGGTRLVRDRQSRVDVANSDRRDAAPPARNRTLGIGRVDPPAAYRRTEPIASHSSVAARAAPQVAVTCLAERAVLQSRGLALRSRSGRWLRCKLQWLGTGGFGLAGAPAARGSAPQGGKVRHGGAAPVASGCRPLSVVGQPAAPY